MAVIAGRLPIDEEENDPIEGRGYMLNENVLMKIEMNRTLNVRIRNI